MKPGACLSNPLRQAAAGVLLLLAPLALPAASVRHEGWGKDAAGNPVELYTLTDGKTEVQVATYGARIVSVRVPNRKGELGNVVLGFGSVESYLEGRNSAMGATIGRYANRIAGGEFRLNGTAYQLSKNNGANTLHGGAAGFDRKVWSAKAVTDGVEMTLVSPDGDMGFPGALTVHVTFRLTKRSGEPALTINYVAETDKPTVINLTNHAYFNLGDDPATPVLKDSLRVEADAYTPVATGGIPTGARDPVAGTPQDFRVAHPLADAAPPRGYDNNFVLRAHPETVPVAEVTDPASGRTVKVFTTEPGLQLYVPLSPAPAPGAVPVAPAPGAAPAPAPRPALAAFCLETQHFPDAPNHPDFPSTTLLPGKRFESTTTYQFGVLK